MGLCIICSDGDGQRGHPNVRKKLKGRRISGRDG